MMLRFSLSDSVNQLVLVTTSGLEALAMKRCEPCVPTTGPVIFGNLSTRSSGPSFYRMKVVWWGLMNSVMRLLATDPNLKVRQR